MTDTDRMVAWLREAMDAAEKVARDTTPAPVPGEWTVVRDKHADDDAPLALIQGQPEEDYEFMGDSYKYGLPVIAIAAEWQDEAEANLRHIALNDPAAVLRRIAADRKMLDLHQTPGRMYEYAGAPPREATICRVCRYQEPMSEDPCATVRLLAEGWGWTEEEQR